MTHSIEPATSADENQIVAERRAKLAALRASGNAYPNDFRRDALAADLHAAHGNTGNAELELRKRQEQQAKLEDSKTDIGWGHQIRSYVLDQSRIKDLRTNYEVGNTQAVLDGGLDDFIAASLKQGV